MAFARLNGVAQHYEDAGAHEGQPIVFSNSLGTDFRIWDGVLPHLPAGLRFIRNHAFDPITIDQVAKATGMCRRVFERRFATQMGRSPKAEVLRLRLERVKQLLTDTDWSLAQIAEKTGFNYGEYLHTVFTRKAGLTPGEFRRQAERNVKEQF